MPKRTRYFQKGQARVWKVQCESTQDSSRVWEARGAVVLPRSIDEKSETDTCGSRIVHVVPSVGLATGGLATAVVGLARAQTHAGCRSSIFATEIATPFQGRALRRGLTSVDLPAGADEVDIRVFPIASPARLGYSPELRTALREQSAESDLIHIHSLFLYPQWSAWRTARKARKPYIVSPHGALDPYLRQRGKIRKAITESTWQRRMLNEAAAIHATSEAERSWLLELGYRAPLVVIPNGLDLSAFRLEPERRAALRNRPSQPVGPGPVIVTHGRLAPKKGLDILVEAFAGLASDLPSMRLLVVGPDDEGIGKELRQLAQTHGCGERVTFSGPLNGADLTAALALGDIWALPSHGENFGMAVIEALAMGLPVVTTAAVNVAPDAAEHGALSISPPTVAGFEGTLRTLLSSQAKRQQLADRGSEYALRYDWQYVGRAYLDLYATIASRQV